ncbi:MAG: Fic family protein [Verrucomicrobia bacterium]|nr:Fic family protein [Verrucomicrobiota bacterium]MBS0636371.1 Fic family protein [Verrucomicrobiota bacterium]
MTPITEIIQQDHTPDQSSTPDKPTGCSWGRMFTKIASTALQVAKVGAIFGLFFIPTAAAPIYMNPGQVLARAGTASCGLNKIAFTPQDCNEITTANLLFLYDKTRPGHFTENELLIPREKGLTRPGGSFYQGTSFRFQIPQDRLIRYERAEEYARFAFTRDVWTGSVEKTIEKFFKLHSLICTNKTEPNEYRKVKIVQSYFFADNASIHELSLTDRERTILLTTDPNKYTTLGPEESEAWSKMLYLSPVNACELPYKMKEFVEEFHRRMREGGDYIDHASFFHAEFTRLQPFFTGVGRIARLMTNLILDEGELHHVVFKDHLEYITAVRSGTKNRAHFTEYLLRSLIWTREKLPHLDNPEHRKIINEARAMHPGLKLENVGRELTGKELSGKELAGKKVNQRVEQEAYYNYHQALYEVRQAHMMTLTEDGLLSLMNRLHILLTQNLKQDEPFKLGEYRTTYMLVDGVGDAVSMLSKAQCMLPPGDFKLFLESITKIQQDITHLGRLSEEEKTLWKDVAHIPPTPDRIATRMQNFVDTLVKRRHEDAVEIASFIHMEIASIWPYGDANGRLARLMMNEWLRLNGKTFITFPDNSEYYKIVSQAVNDYTIFTRYLRRIIQT